MAVAAAAPPDLLLLVRFRLFFLGSYCKFSMSLIDN